MWRGPQNGSRSPVTIAKMPSSPASSCAGLRLAEVLDCMITLLRVTSHDVLLWVKVDEMGTPGPGGCVEIASPHSAIERLLNQACNVDAKRMIVASQDDAPDISSGRDTFAFSKSLSDSAARRGILVERHLFVSLHGHSSIAWPSMSLLSQGPAQDPDLRFIYELRGPRDSGALARIRRLRNSDRSKDQAPASSAFRA
jgi:hypothetical protein